MDNFSLDIRTLNFIIILFSCIYSIGLIFYQFNQRKIPGLSCFAISLLFIGGGPFLLSFRDSTSDWLTVTASNTIILIGFLLTLYGLSIFRAFPLNIARYLTAVLPFTSVGIYYFTFHSPSIRSRIIIVSLYLSAVTFASAYAMLKGKNRDLQLPTIGMAASLFGFSTFMIGRTMWTYFDSELYNFMTAGLVHQLTFLFSICLVVSMSFCMLWLINARLLQSIRSLSFQDALTGLLNRRAMEDVIPNLVAKTVAKQEPLSIIMTDIDNFKYINDEFGHLAGDNTIVSVANIMSRNLPKEAQVIRFGGDEFMVVLPKYTAHQAAEHAETLRHSIKNASCQGSKEKRITMSFGVAEIKSGERLHDVISRSDHALYHSKEQGRDRVTMLSAKTASFKQPFYEQRA
ncbi:diguanylate cyclase [Vibrio sp. B1REV9]|uniref:GGDEF domain-containing protein n=1 Tax=Vibrio sp. B1REV9 TaxID=2751179 RepID=UPI001AF5B00A|nr:GGDEF domain-containing protein [Vibrio sp. B1REV9]CAE6933025.1 diguanylate cyclase [Vibrio sp. B1REV9]